MLWGIEVSLFPQPWNVNMRVRERLGNFFNKFRYEENKLIPKVCYMHEQ